MSDLKLNQGDLSRRKALLSLSTLLATGLFAKSAYADLVNELLGRSGRSLIDKTIRPSSSLIVVEGASETYSMRTTGLPDHATGTFPNEGCPNSILPVLHVFKIPKNPQVASTVTELRGNIFGVAVNGVVFDPSGPFWKENSNSGWQYEVMSSLGRYHLGIDLSNAHTQNTGEYHYHGRCAVLQERLEALLRKRGETVRMILLGFAADGFPIYAPFGPENPSDPRSPSVPLRSSYQLRTGTRGAAGPGQTRPDGSIDRGFDGSFVQDYNFEKGSGHLDECNGRFGVTPEYPAGIYYYVLTDTFPFIPRFYRGTPNESFFKAPPSSGGGSAAVPAGLTKIFG